MINNDREYLLEEELLLVRHSGEIPEVALHGSLHYLCNDPEGPCLILADEELRPFQEAALERYQEIILRDLDPANRDRSLFRGIKRAFDNWQRFARFSEQIGSSPEEFRKKVAHALFAYLEQEIDEVRCGKRLSSINCTVETLVTFAQILGMDSTVEGGDWACLCEQTG